MASPAVLLRLPDAAEVDLVGVARARADALGVDVVGVVVVGVEQPLVVVQVEDVLFLGPGVDVAKLDEVADVAVVHVGGVGRVKGFGGLGADRVSRDSCRTDRLKPHIGRHVHQHGRVAHRKGGQKELLVGAGQAVVHGPHAQAVGDDLRADAARAVVDHERIAHAVQGVARAPGH